MVTIISLPTPEYNCIAWAAEDDQRWWWPNGPYYWPDGVAREETIDAFIAVYQSLGYEICRDGTHEAGIQKIALYVNSKGKPTHAARQLLNGTWTSKLGAQVDVEHDTPESVLSFASCNTYGRPTVFMSKAAGQAPKAA